MKIKILKIKLRVVKIFLLMTNFNKKRYLKLKMKFYFCFKKIKVSLKIHNNIFIKDFNGTKIFNKGSKIIAYLQMERILYTKLLYSIEKFCSLIEKNNIYISCNHYKGCILEIYPNMGGKESEDWTRMLIQMYRKWLIKKNFNFSIENLQTSILNVRSIMLKITNNTAFFLLKREVGIHKLIRLSPLSNKKKRHTTLAEVILYPTLIKKLNKNINSSELIIHTYKSSGAGGQHVNTTDSAVRVKHIPSNITIQCQRHRSQHKNKKVCINTIKERLYAKEIGEKKLIQKSNIIVRSYILDPYKLVKDHQTKIFTTNVNSVLNGNIDPFIYN